VFFWRFFYDLIIRDDVLRAIFDRNDSKNELDFDSGDSTNIDDDDETALENNVQTLEDACFRDSVLNTDVLSEVSSTLKHCIIFKFHFTFICIDICCYSVVKA
jgi:hypothetical protein